MTFDDTRVQFSAPPGAQLYWDFFGSQIANCVSRFTIFFFHSIFVFRFCIELSRESGKGVLLTTATTKEQVNKSNIHAFDL